MLHDLNMTVARDRAVTCNLRARYELCSIAPISPKSLCFNRPPIIKDWKSGSYLVHFKKKVQIENQAFEVHFSSILRKKQRFMQIEKEGFSKLALLHFKKKNLFVQQQSTLLSQLHLELGHKHTAAALILTSTGP